MAMSWCARGTACDKNERTCALVSVRKVPKNQGMSVYERQSRIRDRRQKMATYVLCKRLVHVALGTSHLFFGRFPGPVMTMATHVQTFCHLNSSCQVGLT